MAEIYRSAPGKLILCGEHAVVYGQPAIAVPVDQVRTTTSVIALPQAKAGVIRLVAPGLGVDEDLSRLPEAMPLRRSIGILLDHFSLQHIPACEIRINSTIPMGSGLGSSASTVVSLILAVSDFLGRSLKDEETNLLAFEMEKLFHGTPSGIDNTVVTYDRPVFFVKGEPAQFLQVAHRLHLLIADSGIRASTAEAVGKVKEKWQADPRSVEALFAEIGALTHRTRSLLTEGNIEKIGALLTRDHALLRELTVSCPELDKLVETALEAGAWGAKLSGGGLGGNILALVDPADTQRITDHLSQAGARSVIQVSIQNR